MSDIVKLDLETYWDGKVNLKKLGPSLYVRHPEFKFQQLGLQINDGPVEIINGAHDDLIIDPIGDRLRDIDWSQAILVCHNMLFDGFALSHHYNIIPKLYIDTLAMARARYFFWDNDLDELDHRLHNIGKQNKGALEAIKGVRNPTAEQLADLAIYTTGDMAALSRCYESLVHHFPTSELKIIDMTIRMFTEPTLEVDHDIANRVSQAETDAKQALCDDLGVTMKQIRSNDQFKELIEHGGVKVPLKMSPTTGEMVPAFAQADAGFQELCANEDVGDLMEARQRIKTSIVETRSKGLSNNAQDGFKLPVALNYWGTVTGRWSGTNKINMQNLPKSHNFRHMVVAPEGQVLVVCDSSQIECRLTAWFADQFNLLKVFADKGDPYCDFATTYYGRPITKADELERFMGKSAVLGLGYGMGADRFYDDTKSKAALFGVDITVTHEDAQRAVDTYRTIYGNIRQMWSNCERWLNIMARDGMEDQWKCVRFRDQKLWLPNNMYIHYPNLNFAGQFNDYRRRSKTPIKNIYSSHFFENIIQALARIVIAEQMLEIQKSLKPVMCTHDEVVCVVPEDDADDALAFMIQCMRTVPEWCKGVPLDAEGKYARYYSK